MGKMWTNAFQFAYPKRPITFVYLSIFMNFSLKFT